MNRIIFPIVIITGAISACAATENYKWVKAGATDQEEAIDFAACKPSANAANVENGTYILTGDKVRKTCMEGKGWHQEPQASK
jgi:hypothetical protein